jgi:hypothetical protein
MSDSNQTSEPLSAPQILARLAGLDEQTARVLLDASAPRPRLPGLAVAFATTREQVAQAVPRIRTSTDKVAAFTFMR